MMSLAVGGVPREDTGIASALLNASQQIGGSLGIALLTAVAAARFDAVRPKHPTPSTLAGATTSSWVWGFFVAAVLLLCAAITTALLVRGQMTQPPSEAESSAAAHKAAVEPAITDEQLAVTPTRESPEVVPLPFPCHGSATTGVLAGPTNVDLSAVNRTSAAPEWFGPPRRRPGVSP